MQTVEKYLSTPDPSPSDAAFAAKFRWVSIAPLAPPALPPPPPQPERIAAKAARTRRGVVSLVIAVWALSESGRDAARVAGRPTCAKRGSPAQ